MEPKAGRDSSVPRMLYFGCHLVGALIESYEARSTYPVLRCPFGRVTSEPHGKFPRRTTGLITSMSCTGPSGLGCYSLATCLNAYIFPLPDTSCGGRWKHPAGVTPVGSLCYLCIRSQQTRLLGVRRVLRLISILPFLRCIPMISTPGA